MAGVLHIDALDMAPADISTTIRKGTDWTVGIRLRTGQSLINLSAYTMQSKIYGASGSLLKTLTGLQTSTECINFAMTHEETTVLAAQNGKWEIWGTRIEDDFIMLLVAGRATIV